MRPEILFPLFAPVTSIKGVGPRIGQLMEKVGGSRVVDLCWHLPLNIIDRRATASISAAVPGSVCTLVVQVDEHKPAMNRRMPYAVQCSDESGTLRLVFFHADARYLRRALPEETTRVVSGVIEVYQDQMQMTHPDYIVPLEERQAVERIEPVYGLTAGLTQRVMGRAMAGMLERLPDPEEWLDAAFVSQRHWPSWKAAVEEVHAPQGLADISPETPARQRLAYDELLANQLALALVRARMKSVRGRAIAGNGSISEKILKALPFELTGAQERALSEIRDDLAEPARMMRLLQGDVGSGKTAVALLAMATAAEERVQAVLMAPTEILARQHFGTIASLAEVAGLKIEMLTGRHKGKTRREILARIKSGEAQIVVGTHALFQADVDFHDLGFAVIDEQHRFGVHQRMQLADKSGEPLDTLVMTATPIPRTLTLTAYGDMDVSRLDEKPPGRKPIDTRALPVQRLPEVIDGVQRLISRGSQVFWVCPLVEESDILDVSAAEDRYAMLNAHFGGKVGLVHGKMKTAEKDAVMDDFVSGKIRVLVATTVIEVGVDVPGASAMVIEHAERFGLAQLHQLRGRVGRGTEQSSCLLLYGSPLSENARARIDILRQTEDGFEIAEEDLRLRGAGDLLGTSQSGLPVFRMANIVDHAELMMTARDDVKLIMASDQQLQTPRGQALRTLLYLFERDTAIQYLRTG